jgi:hypothetical protein
MLLTINDEYYFTVNVDYHLGQRCLHLKRDDSKPDELDELIKAHVEQS